MYQLASYELGQKIDAFLLHRIVVEKIKESKRPKYVIIVIHYNFKVPVPTRTPEVCYNNNSLLLLSFCPNSYTQSLL